MPSSDLPSPSTPRKRADALRNQEKLLSAAAAVFVRAGVDAPIRQIAAEAGVGTATIYRHFPTRADLIAAVFRFQVEECVDAGPRLLDSAATPFEALRQWIDAFVDFLVTKHGLAKAMHSDIGSFLPLQTYFIDRLLPVFQRLLEEAVAAGEVRPGVEAYELLRAVGNLCIGRDDDASYSPRRMIELLLLGLRRT